MSDTPTSRVITQPPLLVYVETEPGSDEWVADPRCRVDEIKLGLAQEFSTATIRVFPGAIDSPSAGVRAGLAGNWTEDALEPGQVLHAIEDGVGERAGTPFAKFISPDQGVMIARDWPDGEGPRPDVAGGYREVLFAGFCDLPRYDQPEGGARIGESYTLLVEDGWKRANLTDETQVYGRWMRKAAAYTAWKSYVEINPSLKDEPYQSPAAAQALDDLVHVERMPCVFNPGGRGNCSPAPVEVNVDRGNGPEPIRVYVFTHERDADAIQWTYARALRYLVFFHYLGSDVSVLAEGYWYRQDGADVAAEDLPAPIGLLAAGEMLHGGSKLVEITPDEAAEPTSPAARPAAPPVPAEALVYELLGRPTELEVDKTVFGEAIRLFCEAAGLRCAARAENWEVEDEPTGLPVVRLYLWAVGAGRVNNFSRSGVSDGMSVQEILDANHVAALSLQQDFSDVFPSPDIYGDTERYEVTVELVPGWMPDPNLDEGDTVDNLLTFAKEHDGMTVEDGLHDDPWYQRYHRNGELFQDYRHVGRRWVLNECGSYPAQRVDVNGEPFSPAQHLFARTTAHHAFGLAAYEPWAAHKSNIRRPVIDNSGDVRHVPVRAAETDVPEDDGGDFAAEQLAEISRPWVLAPRPLHDCLSADEDRHTLGIVVEVTRDNKIAGRDGLSEEDLRTALDARAWVRLQGFAIITLNQQASIYLDAEDLTQVFPWKDDEDAEDEQGDNLSLWAAIVEGRLGVRVTAVIDGDHFVRPNLDGDEPITGVTRQFEMDKKFHQNRRDLANSVFAEYPEGEAEYPDGNLPAGNKPAPASTKDADDDDDLLELQSQSQALRVTCQARIQPGAIHVPWVTQQWLIGDTVQRIDGAGIEFFSSGPEDSQRHPDVVAVAIRPGRTIFFLEDTRLLEEMQRDPLGPFVAAKMERDEKVSMEA